jgi:hypothetical protein
MSTGLVTRPRSRARSLANALMVWVLRHGGGPSFLSLLTVRGRNSGQRRSTPVAPVRRDDDLWVVAPYGPVAWVRSSDDAIAAEAPRHPVFALTPADPDDGRRGDAS